VVRPAALLKRSLIFVHRWLGVALAVLFVLWFVSGIVMMYWSFPAVEASDRLERLPVLDPDQLKVSAAAAAASTGRDLPAGQVRLTSFDGRPAWRLGGRGGWSMVFADDGTPADVVDDALIERAVSAWARRPVSEATRASVEEVDQWTVGSSLRNLRPLYKYSFPDGQQVYINGNTAEVVQYTTASSRFWAYLGAIPHWMYFTPLRKHQPQWFKFVVWTSLIGTVASLMGVVIGVWMLSPKKRYRHAGAPTSVPYKGWKRWHTLIGLVFGIVTATWAFSGLLSMGPFPIMDRLTDLTVPAPADLTRSAPQPPGPAAREAGGRGGRSRGPNIAAALRGRGAGSLSDFEEKDPRTALASIRDFGARELELTSFDGQPVYLAINGTGDTRIVPVRGPPRDSFTTDEVMRVVREAAGKSLTDLRVMNSYDAYYLDRRRERPLPVVYAEMNDALRSRFYIDPKTARVVGTYNARNWVNRWLYNGLHSLNFPWLYNHRPLWDIVVITLMLGGTALCVTSLVLAWRVLARKVARLMRARFNIPNEDLVHETLS
jgi:uncharacterized iron-regulated membrane protein